MNNNTKSLVTVLTGVTAFFGSVVTSAVTHADPGYVYGGFQLTPVYQSYYSYAYETEYTGCVPYYAPVYRPLSPAPYPYGYGIAPVVSVTGYAPVPTVYSPYHNGVRVRYHVRY